MAESEHEPVTSRSLGRRLANCATQLDDQIFRKSFKKLIQKCEELHLYMLMLIWQCGNNFKVYKSMHCTVSMHALTVTYTIAILTMNLFPTSVVYIIILHMIARLHLPIRSLYNLSFQTLSLLKFKVTLLFNKLRTSSSSMSLAL